MTLHGDRRYNESKELVVQVMETFKAKLGAGHPGTLTRTANLALKLWNQGRWEEAEKLKVEMMEMTKTKVGAGHPDTLTSMNNLAFTWKGLDRDAESIQLMKECVQR